MRRPTLSVVPVALVAALALAACGGDDSTAGDSTPAPATSSDMTGDMTSEPMTSDDMTSDAMSSDEMTSGAMADDAMAAPVGPGCAAYAEQVPDGAGSIDGMTQDPVATAASNNPILTTLTAAVSGGLNPGVNLVDTLNGGEFTVFAPVDDAFAAVDPATIETLKTDSDLLTTILTYHVVPGQLSPDEIAGTTQTTVQGGTVEVTGTPDMLMVNGASVVCGGVHTANATVYLIDQVLTPAG
jgi:pentapeptide MXKDX repeat protein